MLSVHAINELKDATRFSLRSEWFPGNYFYRKKSPKSQQRSQHSVAVPAGFATSSLLASSHPAPPCTEEATVRFRPPSRTMAVASANSSPSTVEFATLMHDLAVRTIKPRVVLGDLPAGQPAQ